MRAFDPAAVDLSADPCADFYQFSCGGWHRAHPMPATESFWSRPFTQFSRQVDRFVLQMIEGVALGRSERTPDAQRVGDYFAACMDTAAIEARGTAPLALELAPVDRMQSIEELPRVLGAIHGALSWYPQKAEPLIYLDARRDPGGELFALRIGPAGIGLRSPDYYSPRDEDSRALLRDYERHVARTLELSGLPAQTAARQAQAVVALETELAASYLNKALTRNDPTLTNNPMKLAELLSLTPHFDWREYFRSHGLPPVSDVNVKEVEYLRTVDRLIQEVPLTTWQAYLRWQLVSERTDVLPRAFREERFDFYGRRLLEVEEPPDRSRQCVEAIKFDLPSALGRLFVDRVFRPELRTETRSVFEQIRRVTRSRIEAAEWLQPSTRREAIAKVDAMGLNIGHPDRWLDDERVVVRADDAYGNARRTGRAMRRVSFHRLGKAADVVWWDASVTWVGGYYDSWSNQIFVTAAMLLYLDPTAATLGDENDATDLAVLYGGVGTLLAHELLHGFDPNGRGHDASGSLRDWWTAADAAAFEERSECVADEFSGFEYAPGIPVDGNYVVSEQFTEISATRIAWEAFLRQERPTESSSSVDGYGVRLTDAQRFYVTMAQTWCSEATEGTWRAMASGGSSKAWAAPMVHGTVLNVPEFVAAFGCQASDPLVKEPEAVCQGW